MKFPSLVVLPATLFISAFLAGCVTEQGPAPAAAASAAAQPGAKPVPSVPSVDIPEIAYSAAVAPPEAPLPPSEEAVEVVARLTKPLGNDSLPHELSDNSSFPEALASLQKGAKAPKFESVEAGSQPPPQGLTADGNTTTLVVRDWTGLVLVPINASFSKAYTTGIRLLKVEAHPLRDGRVRIWIRVQNLERQDISSEIACSFRMKGDGTAASANFYEVDVPSRNYRDVFFVSPEGQLNTYTVLVRRPH